MGAVPAASTSLPNSEAAAAPSGSVTPSAVSSSSTGIQFAVVFYCIRRGRIVQPQRARRHLPVNPSTLGGLISARQGGCSKLLGPPGVKRVAPFLRGWILALRAPSRKLYSLLILTYSLCSRAWH